MTRNASDVKHLDRLRNETRSLLGRVLEGGSRDVAYLDVPTHRNLGDSLIWAGSLRYLRDIECRVLYSSNAYAFDPESISRLPSETVLVLHGGGNLGDLYPQHEQFRHFIIDRYPKRRIVVLPQSIFFREDRNLSASVRAYRSARNLTILLRDRPSMDIAETHFGGLDVRYCYDAAMGFEPPVTLKKGKNDVLILARTDSEARVQDGPHLLGASDWETPKWNSFLWRQTLRTLGLYRRIPAPLRAVSAALQRQSYSALVNLNVSAALRQIAPLSALATNRLHAHVLAGLIGIPHAVTDNSYGKISAIFNEYTGRFSSAHWANSLEEAEVVARELALSSPEM